MLLVSVLSGNSNIMGSIVFSMIERSPRAPVFCLMAWSAIIVSAGFVNFNSAPSILTRALYCFTIAFFGSVRMRHKSSFVKGFSTDMIGNLPISSGIIPNFTRS